MWHDQSLTVKLLSVWNVHRTWTPFDEIINEIDMVCDVMWCDVMLRHAQWCCYCYISISHFNKAKNSCAPFQIISGFARLKLSKMTWLNCTCSNFMWAIWPFATQCTRHVQCAAMRCAVQHSVRTHFIPGIIFLSMQINRLCASFCVSSYTTLESICKMYLQSR